MNKNNSLVEKTHEVSPKPLRFEGWRHHDGWAFIGMTVHFRLDDGWTFSGVTVAKRMCFKGFWPWFGWLLTLRPFAGMTVEFSSGWRFTFVWITVEPSSGWRFNFAYMTVEPSSGWRFTFWPSWGWRLNLRKDDDSSSPMFPQNSKHYWKIGVMSNGFQSWYSVPRERERVFRNASNEARRKIMVQRLLQRTSNCSWKYACNVVCAGLAALLLEPHGCMLGFPSQTSK